MTQRMKALRTLTLVGMVLCGGVFMTASAQSELPDSDVPRNESGVVVTKEPVVFLKDKAQIVPAKKIQKVRRKYRMRRHVRPCSFGLVYTY